MTYRGDQTPSAADFFDNKLEIPVGAIININPLSLAGNVHCLRVFNSRVQTGSYRSVVETPEYYLPPIGDEITRREVRPTRYQKASTATSAKPFWLAGSVDRVGRFGPIEEGAFEALFLANPLQRIIDSEPVELMPHNYNPQNFVIVPLAGILYLDLIKQIDREIDEA
jgi:hypothetical protein